MTSKYSDLSPRIEKIDKKKLLGMRTRMSLVNNKTGQLWAQFSPRIREIENRVSSDKISLQVYPALYYRSFNPTTEFEKWALVEVSVIENIPREMEEFTLKSGPYAVFDYKGLSNDPSIFQYIFSDWLPKSDYVLDDRPHFEVLGSNYRNNDPNSEEEIWIPIQAKA